jgi:hypothetical protein
VKVQIDYLRCQTFFVLRFCPSAVAGSYQVGVRDGESTFMRGLAASFETTLIHRDG